ncbi:MAG TPA: asparaginase [Acidobacteriota bacterium]|nr:asparaginase [Acidobacteriota bacterium]HNC42785.1 asparaginase [Acidobacteriota bacterium]
MFPFSLPNTVPPVLVEITRGGLTESQIRGMIAVVEPTGRLVASIGQIDFPCYLRSVAKPFQSTSLFLTGVISTYHITPRELAVMTSSHNGERFHVACVREILARIAIPEACLRCGVHLPFNEASIAAMNGQNPQPIHNNCSGKHAGMLTAARLMGAPLETYEETDHPVQVLNREQVAYFTDVPASELSPASDGCTVPTWPIPLRNLALGYARLAAPENLPLLADVSRRDQTIDASRQIVQAMMQHPEMVGGTGRIDTALMQAVPGKLVSKVGAEGVHAFAVLPCDSFPTGLGMAIKLEDGDNFRARHPVVIAVLEQLGVVSSDQAHRLRALYAPPIRNCREEIVGEPRVVFSLKNQG